MVFEQWPNDSDGVLKYLAPSPTSAYMNNDCLFINFEIDILYKYGQNSKYTIGFPTIVSLIIIEFLVP